jgi:division/cell wall cluster transcriptional repressor MraZ
MLDEKNRLTIPAKWRFRGDEGDSAYLALPNPNGSITVYPPKMVEAIELKIQNVSMLGDSADVATISNIFGGGEHFGCDKQGRFGLSEGLRQHAGLKLNEEAVLVGTVTVFHIWTPERHKGLTTSPPGTMLFDPSLLRKYGL